MFKQQIILANRSHTSIGWCMTLHNACIYTQASALCTDSPAGNSDLLLAIIVGSLVYSTDMSL